MNEFINKRNRSITVRPPAQILSFNNGNNLYIGLPPIPAEDADFVQFEQKHAEDHTSSDYLHDDFDWKGGRDGN